VLRILLLLLSIELLAKDFSESQDKGSAVGLANFVSAGFWSFFFLGKKSKYIFGF